MCLYRPQNTDFIVVELDVFQFGVELVECLSQGIIDRIYRPFSRLGVCLILPPTFTMIVASLHDSSPSLSFVHSNPEAYEVEKSLMESEGFFHQKLE